MARRYKRKSSIFSDVNYIGSRLSWWGALVFALFSFTLFYFVIPAWLELKLSERSESNMYPILEAVFGRRIHWFEYLGVASGVLCLYYSVRNYFVGSYASSDERGIVGILSKLIGRKIE